MTQAAPDIWTLLTATLVGLLIGLERERKRERTGTIFAGVRTFPLIALFGAVAGLLTAMHGPLVLVASSLGLFALVAVSYWRVSVGPKIGATTEVAALVTFGLGALAGHGEHITALAGAVIATTFLSLREELHGFAGSLDRADLFAMVQFAVVTLVVLPLLPDTRLGPWEVWNPRTIWYLVVLISGTSFLGYAAGKVLGARRGLVLGGLLGGLASSTAVTMAHSQRARLQPELAGPLAIGTLAANAVMAPRALLVLWWVSPALAARLALPALVLAGAAAVGAAVLLARTARAEDTAAPLRNPFELRSALTFAFIYAALLLLTQMARIYIGDGGVYLAGLLSGAGQLDAATLTLAEQSQRGLDLGVAATAATLALASNALFKALLALGSRTASFAWAVALPLLLGAGLALAGVWFLG